MISVLKYIIDRLLLAIVPTIVWNIASIFIMYGLYKIKGKDILEDYTKNCSYIFITNYILIFLYLCFFYRENI